MVEAEDEAVMSLATEAKADAIAEPSAEATAEATAEVTTETAAEAVAETARAIGVSSASRGNLEEALEAVCKLDLDPAPRILITGSLYLAGDVLRENGTPPG